MRHNKIPVFEKMSSPRKAKKSLTNEEKNQMVQEYKSTKISQRDLADKYDVSKTLVQKVLKEEKESVEDILETIDCDGSSSSLQNFDSLEDLDKFIEFKEQEIDHSVLNGEWIKSTKHSMNRMQNKTVLKQFQMQILVQVLL